MNTYRIEGVLRIHGVGGRSGGPFHLGASDGESDYVDCPVHRDSTGVPLLPGTSLCGVLAGLAGDVLSALGHSPESHPAFIGLFGAAKGGETASGQESRLLVPDAFMENAVASVRDRNGMNRARGSADMHRLFHEEVMEGGGWFPLRLEFNGSGPKSSEEEALANKGVFVDLAAFRLLLEVLQLLSAGWARIGGKVGVGYGHVLLEKCRIAQYDRCDPDQVCCYALSRWADFHRNPIEDYLAATSALSPGKLTAARERIRFTCTLRPLEPLLVKTGYSSEVCGTTGCRHPEALNQGVLPLDWQAIPMEFAVDGAFRLDPSDVPYVPGSSLRGAIRSHAERAVRTIVGPEAAWNLTRAEEMGKRFSDLEDFDEDDVACLVSRVFGFSALGGRVMVSDGVPISPDMFKSRRKLLDHVALDRFTGGAADRHKFNARPYFPPPVEDPSGDMCFHIELWDFQPWHLGMLLLLLRDLRLGRISIGHGKTKGYGKVRLETAAVKGLAAVLPKKGSLAGGLDVFEASVCFDEDHYLRSNTHAALAKFFSEAEAAFRLKMQQWEPMDEADFGGRADD